MEEGKAVRAEYDAVRRVLQLDEPLEGVADHASVDVVIARIAEADPSRSWMKFEGCLDSESGREIAQAIKDAFGRDTIEV